MAGSITVNAPTTFAVVFLCAMFVWVAFLIFDARRRPNTPSTLRQIGLLCHTLPAWFLLATALTAQSAEDTALVWFVAALIFRYWRTLVSIWFWFQYEIAVATSDFKMTSKDCTVIVPTVGPKDNDNFDDMVAAILINRPARLVFSTNTESAAQEVEALYPQIVDDLEAGKTPYQAEHKLGPFEVTTKILVKNAEMSNKRKQVVHAFSNVETDILVMVDDTAIWQPKFLLATLPAFQSERVGFVGTRKWVKHLSHPRDASSNLIWGLVKQYRAGFWNAIGGLYLTRHNFEIRSTNAADGGVFCVSGRSSLIRTKIVMDEQFKHAFLNEYVLRLGKRFPGYGPVTADDDNFLTSWVNHNDWDIKIQSSKDATMTTTLGTYPLKFNSQCRRWSRTTFRQNPIALFSNRTVWWTWPLTTWTTLLPWLYNAALFWDGLAVYTLIQSDLYAQSAHRRVMLSSLIGFIWMSKLVKTIPWFWAYPKDFLLYFMIPAYPAFVYWHSLMKIYTAFTFWDLTWSGRKLD